MLDTPSLFLHRPFGPDVAPKITEGWYYSDEEVALHGEKLHSSVDFAMPAGTPVLASADGLAVASFQEVAVRRDDNAHRTHKGRPIYFGAGLVVKVFHSNGWCTLYCHLLSVAEAFYAADAYYPPAEDENGDLQTTNLRIPLEQLQKVKHVAVKAGQEIGRSGITGMGWGTRTYEHWKKKENFEVCDEEHLHLQVAHNKKNDEDKYPCLDPFNLYAKYDAYPLVDEDWSQLDGSLWFS